MQKRRVGRTKLEIAPLMLGGNVFGWTANEATSLQILDAFVDAGFNAIDTADVYMRYAPGNTGGESETIIGKWLKASGKRDKVFIATKCGMDMGDGKKGLSKKYILQAAEASLKRLQTDYIDLYQAHQDDADTPLEETISAFDELVKSGKARAVGASNYSAARLTEALGVSASKSFSRYETLQPLYNLYDREPYETELSGVCAKNEIGVITWYSLAAGFLTGKYRSEKELKGSPRDGNYKKRLDARGLRVLSALDDAAAKHKGTPAQIALAWLMAQPTVLAPIVSATSLQQLADILKSVEIKLDSATLKALDEASRP